jgi:trehalose 6-phosphate synthase
MQLDRDTLNHLGARKPPAASRRLVVASNRLPIVVQRGDNGSLVSKPASGGLVHSLKYVLQERRGTWFGWLGATETNGLDEILEQASADLGYVVEPIPLTTDQVDRYYHGFSNEVIWPLFHDMVSRCNFQASYWDAYQDVNQLFARSIAEHTNEDHFVWVQDYHLMLVGDYLRQLGAERGVGYFLHIPFPNPDIFAKLPWRFEVLRALLEYDTLGFQTVRDARNFIQCVRGMLRGAHVSRSADTYLVAVEGRIVSVGNFPIGIDFAGFDGRSRAVDVERAALSLKEKLPNRQLILGIDRLDYTKGIPERLYAFQNALRRYPDLIDNVSLIQVVVPSREDVPEYRLMKNEVEQLVSEINGEFTSPGWVPVHYIFRSLTDTELLSFYRGADISLVTPLKDGMNLISKEYAAASIDETGVLILSEFAGSAAQLQGGALLVNPHDVEGTADAIYAAFTMPYQERRARMRRLRRVIERTNVFWWTDAFLELALEGGHTLKPSQSYYIPSTDVSLNGEQAQQRFRLEIMD